MATTTKTNTTTTNAANAAGSPATATRMRMLGADETFSPVMTVDPKTRRVTCAFTVRASETGPRFVVNTVLDWADVAADVMLQWASRPVVIDAQRQFRVMHATDAARALNPKTWAQLNVQSDVIDRERNPVDPFARAKSAVSRLTAAQRAELAKMLADAERAERAAKPAKNAA